MEGLGLVAKVYMAGQTSYAQHPVCYYYRTSRNGPFDAEEVAMRSFRRSAMNAQEERRLGLVGGGLIRIEPLA